MRETILLSGGTGFLGTELASLLCSHEVTIYALVRARDEEEGFHRLRQAWYPHQTLYGQIGKKVFPVCGDFTREGLGLNEEKAQHLKEKVTLVIHAGAEVGFDKSREELVRTNLDGTRHMLSFSRGLVGLRRFVHISTAYVAGTQKGKILEEAPLGEGFSSQYEKTKAEAEELVKKSGLPYSICRPGMIVGDSRTGWVKSFNTIYYCLKLLLLGKLRVLPISKSTPLNLVPVDMVAESIVRICESEKALGRCFHLTCPGEIAPTAGELVDYVRDWARENLGEELSATLFVPLPLLRMAGLRFNQREEKLKKGPLSNLLTLLPYFYSRGEFDRTGADEICGRPALSWRDYIGPLLAFACRKNFMRQTGQTVFEQARVRRSSTRYPVRYLDVSSEEIKAYSGDEVNEKIDKISSALYAWGIRKGDRVALTGINCAEHLALEQAIGLLGAVSVPIYYTTPAAEAAMLIERSGAGWFFIGDERMMKQVEKIQTPATLVSFLPSAEGMSEKVMSWEAFLAKGTEPAPPQYPDPEDLATIRFTSGTTGDPKGVMFSQAQLAWMGEVLTGLLPWKERNRSMRYLSFLPLSHVVEGILASYTPYYLLCQVDYYYLKDFGSLTQALPKVRPTVFFSVPRFYEKVWDQVTGNRLGKRWLSMKEGLAKKALGKVLKRAVLKKAGIDACQQLIVGSAPVSASLLTSFRSLGIEVHNAYGQTEAPLITINRLGDNVIPTIGTPLPDTSVWVSEDGELIVEGPQVCLGYYGMESESIQGGVLRTGDLGQVGEDGHITLQGRKKDFLVTAYGKNISFPKIEERLKDIPGVSQAVLVGEGKPYCTALLWLEGEVKDLEGAIDRINQDLSHPEQVRRFQVIERPLSIQAGELTPNLKVKRAAVQEHFSKEIEEMYR